MSAEHAKTVILIAGPTAVGKTAVAIDIAKRFHTEIISADSRQCYRELHIGVARPSIGELQQVPHHFIASHTVQEDVTAATFEAYALQKCKELFLIKDVVVMTGGTGLYIRAFCEGLDAIPEIPAPIRQAIIDGYEAGGIGWLQSEIQEKDLSFYEQGEIQNPTRLMRALEVVLATGESILHFRTGNRKTRDFNIIKIGLELPRTDLYDRINSRVDKMLEAGLLDEATRLVPFRHYHALQTVGYTELFQYFDGDLSLEKAVELIKTHTRRYAKRQLTWFRKDKEWEWFAPTNYAELVENVKSKVERNSNF